MGVSIRAHARSHGFSHVAVLKISKAGCATSSRYSKFYRS